MSPPCVIRGYWGGRTECALQGEHDCLLDHPLPDEVVEAIRDSLAPFLNSIRTATTKED